MWLERPGHKTEQDLMVFHDWLERHWPELLDGKGPGSFQTLKTELAYLWAEGAER